MVCDPGHKEVFALAVTCSGPMSSCCRFSPPLPSSSYKYPLDFSATEAPSSPAQRRAEARQQKLTPLARRPMAERSTFSPVSSCSVRRASGRSHDAVLVRGTIRSTQSSLLRLVRGVPCACARWSRWRRGPQPSLGPWSPRRTTQVCWMCMAIWCALCMPHPYKLPIISCCNTCLALTPPPTLR